MKKLPIILVMLFVCLLVLSQSCAIVEAVEPYEGYNYSYWLDAVPSPIAYTPDRVIDGNVLGIGSFLQPNDIFVRDGLIYLLDTGNQRIVILTQEFQVSKIITGFQNGDKTDGFLNPQGLFVTDKGDIYVADTDNKRIVQLDKTGAYIREFGAPQSEILRSNFQYIPTKVGVDRAGRIYTVSRGVVEGIIESDSEGHFTSFLGAPRVTFNLSDMIWKRLATKIQREKMIQFIPTEFDNLDVDPNGFILATTQTKSVKPIQRLNPMGLNILKTTLPYEPIGDLVTAYNSESIFSDIKAGDSGIYSALDSKNGKIFTYDEDGHLLYVFGQTGQQNGSFRTPVAIDYLNEDILVLDRDQALLTLFEPTIFGSTVNQAIKMQFEGKVDEAYVQWQKVLKMDANYDLAYVGIGKANMLQESYQEAMKNFKLGMDRKYYSKAFQMVRKQFVRRYFSSFMTILLIVIAAWVLLPRLLRKLKLKKAGGAAS